MGALDDKILKHLEFIQAAVARLAQCSFMIKGWSVTLVSALFALAAKDSNARMVAVAYVPVAVFWLLDGYFLWQERLFRSLYDEVRGRTSTDFSMNTRHMVKGDATWIGSVVSATLLLFHGVLLAAVIVAYNLLKA